MRDKLERVQQQQVFRAAWSEFSFEPEMESMNKVSKLLSSVGVHDNAQLNTLKIQKQSTEVQCDLSHVIIMMISFQKRLGLAEYTPSPRLFLGHGIRDYWNMVSRANEKTISVTLYFIRINTQDSFYSIKNTNLLVQVKEMRAVRTREWFPPLDAATAQASIEKIDAVKKVCWICRNSNETNLVS